MSFEISNFYEYEFLSPPDGVLLYLRNSHGLKGHTKKIHEKMIPARAASSMKNITKMLVKEKKIMARTELTRSISTSTTCSELELLKLNRLECKVEVVLTFFSSLLDTI